MTDYSKLKVAELKDLLKERGIPPTGLTRKQQLIDALEEDDNETGAGSDGDDDGQVSAPSNPKKRSPSPTPANDGPTKLPKKTKSADTATAAKSESAVPKAKVAEAQFAKSSQQLSIPVDEGCYLAAYRVYVDPGDGIIYDASLNQTNASNNNNKFYRVQV